MINKKTIKKLAIASFNKTDLSEAKVRRISSVLERRELKDYIKALRKIESKKTVTLIVPDEEIESVEAIAQKLRIAYPNKKVMIKVDPSLIAGIKVVNDDLIYEVSIKQILDDLINKL